MDKAKIRAAAEKATKGPWEVRDNAFGKPVLVREKHNRQFSTQIASCVNKCAGDTPDEIHKANAKFIALTDPDTIIAMCDEIDKQEGEIKRLRDALEKARLTEALKGGE